MKQNFEAALAAVLRHEGGYADHPLDPGGPTHRGVTLATLSAIRGRPAAKAELMALSIEETGAIYRSRYWDAVRADEMPSGVDLALFDLAVNSGPRRAALLLQKSLGVAQDGRIGPHTLEAARAADPGALVETLTGARRGFLRGLGAFATFGRGWERRVAQVRAQALALAGSPSPAPSTPRTEMSMDGFKSIFLSRTVLSNVIGFLALALSAFGFETSGLDTGALTDALLQLVAAGGFIASTLFRITATKKLTAKGS